MSGFKSGDLAVYPAHGVGVIDGVESRDAGGEVQDFYVMRILDNNLTIFIPITNADEIGLRAVIGLDEVGQVMTILEEKCKPSTSQTWNRRYRSYMDKIKTGSAFEVAEVYRDLCLIKGGRELSFGERKVLDVAQGLLVRELSVAQNAEENDVTTQIEQIFG